MKDGKAEYAWEELPWQGDEDFALWVEHHEKRHPQMPEISDCLSLSNQMDCQETIEFYTLQQLDDFIARLTRAREWFKDQEESNAR